MAHYFNANTQEADAGESLWVNSQTKLHTEFQINHDYNVRPCLEKEMGNI